MKVLQNFIKSFSKKASAYIPGESFLSVNEMDLVFGGKPEEIASDDAYWWIDEQDLSDIDTLIK
ncbi:hypothetical protein [Hymenobacter swuensis]|uniref:Uncharacterized protein n=1 Tax=Hymenobacter swuensis DY53 TaxID=1227739 RepID=W8ERL6_9BACT|nr:hypothetical protein [Hymenobacter swuensis]AHJ95794.1 hypothetical protein Hsw_0199 [Hymenobacter swuensis DY53]